MVGGVLGGIGHAADRLRDRHLRLAVTGLRRSGKTVFTTVLAQHLLTGLGMPFVRAVHEGRYRGARLRDARGAAFPFRRFLADLEADPPRWPEATETLTTLRLEIRFKSASFLGGYLDPLRRLYLDIVDYPGEWLLDLPLLREDYATFSARSWDLALEGPRRAASEAFRDAATATSADEAALVRLWRDYLRRCQGELALSLVQPGRLPMAKEEAPAWGFCPLPPGTPEGAPLASAMRRRFERYRHDLVEPFYRDHFSRFDRQAVLVDLFASLNRGRHHFEDTQRALEAVMESFRYGGRGWLARLFSPRIDRVLFAASKADHVAANQHPNLKHLLGLMVHPARRHARFEGIEEEVMAIASLRSTDTVRTEHEGQSLSCVRGRLKAGERETVLFPGEIPPDLPEPEDWDSGRFRFHEFAPRRLDPSKPGRHVRLDQAIEFLIGDKLA
ncbi:MAG: YcjX family protein [Geminicoccaceae bacterium]|nr:YcjX family protein [Geminicoccaceae bacterium]